MILRKNFLAGITNSIWSVLVNIITIPLYIKYLGIEAYGLIGFFITTQALLSLLDMGMAPTINREVARCSISGDLRSVGKLLHTLSLIYFAVAVAIVSVILIISPIIAEQWLHAKHIPIQTIINSVMLIGVIVAFRWPIGLYQNVLIGSQNIPTLSLINIFMVTLSNVGALLILEKYSASLEAFFVWQALIGLFYMFVIREAAWKIVGKRSDFTFDWPALKTVLRFSIGMTGVALTAIILAQLDKVLLSKLLNLEDFGRYVLAGMLSSGVYILLTPTFNIIYPKLTQLVEANDLIKLSEFYRSGTLILSSILFPAVIVGIFSGYEIIFVWSGDMALAKSVAPIVSLLLVSVALNGIMHFPYALQLAYGKARIPLLINIALIIFMVPITYFFTKIYGGFGGALAAVILNGFYLILGTIVTHRYLLRNIGMAWLFKDVLFPFCISYLTIYAGVHLMTFENNHVVNFIKYFGLFLLAFLSVIFFLMRPIFWRYIDRLYKYLISLLGKIWIQ